MTPVQRELLEAVEAGHLLHVWAMGRRSGKTLLGVLIGLWFSTLRPDLARHVRRREKRYAVAVATNQRQARIFVDLARTVIEDSPFLSGLVEQITDDRIEFKLKTVLAAFPCTSRGGRGWPIQLLLLDEAAHMLDTDGNQAAEPIFRSLVPSVSQFGANARVIVASSPFGVDGFFADLYRDVEKGEFPDAVFAHASTMEARPGFQTAALELERQRDPEGYRSEYLAEFVPAGGAFLAAWARVEEAIRRGGELRPGKVVSPVAAIDLAFVHDTSALAIIGRDKSDPGRLRLVLARHWPPGAAGFSALLDEIADLCLAHGVTQVFTDQFCAPPAVEHLRRRGVHAQVVHTTADSKSQMFGTLKTRLYEGSLELYRDELLLAELGRVETVTTPGRASVRVRRLGASHGDVVSAVALAVSKLGGAPSRMSVLNPSRFRLPVPGDRGASYADRVGARRAAASRHDGLARLSQQTGISIYDPLSPAALGTPPAGAVPAPPVAVDVPDWTAERGQAELDTYLRRGSGGK